MLMPALVASVFTVAPPTHTVQVGISLPYGVQPGAHVGYRYMLSRWDARRSSSGLAIGLDIEGVIDPGDGLRGSLAAAAGVQWQRSSGFTTAIEANLALLTQRRTLGQSVDLATGALVPDRELGFGLLPRITGRLAWRGNQRVGFFTDLYLGPRIEFGRQSTFEFGARAGVRLVVDQVEEGGER